ncbi:MAG: type III-B CRISPR module RAMP protein Cmr6 [Herpetosiphonaceae bacterium]|nr:type III-B CRISPR module RAMP protein Cmr6 [Herpetosiphonaceae bacterium]
MIARRPTLAGVSHSMSTNAGLWLDKYLREQRERDTHEHEQGQATIQARQELIRQAVTIPVPEMYPAYYQRWQQALVQHGARPRSAKVQGRMVIGLGDESVLETAVALHHTYGVPYIPGSALKGLAASFTQQLEDKQWHPDGEAYAIVFGTPEQAGFIIFWDALYVPGSAVEDQPLCADVMTVHHPEYYQNKNSAPADWDSPTPIPFLSATGAYLVALTAQPGLEVWVDATFEILGTALVNAGIGGKTSSGYGRLSLDLAVADPATPERSLMLTQTSGQDAQGQQSVTPSKGAIVTGQITLLRHDKWAEVRLNKLPPSVIGLLSPDQSLGQASGGIRARIIRQEQQGGVTYLLLERVKKDQL